jgi:cyclic pyranopterin phosphate synthase
MYDGYHRRIDYLRVSLTDRCNLQCHYCMPKGKNNNLAVVDQLSKDEIISVIKEALQLGIRRVRFTGGEPQLFKGILQLVRELKSLQGLEELSLTSNGVLLSPLAEDLKEAGLDRVNISLDTINRDLYKQITTEDALDRVFQGIDAAKKVGFDPIKINAVHLDLIPKEEYLLLEDFCNQRGLQLRYIEEMNLAQGTFSVISSGNRGDCSKCNRLRLLSNGDIKPCLFHGDVYNVKELGIKQALEKACQLKPQRGIKNPREEFYQIGG